MKRFVWVLAVLVLGGVYGVAVSADDDAETARLWTNHAPPFNFLFGNHIDTHQETRLWRRNRPLLGIEKGDLTGWFYVTPSDGNGDGIQDTTDTGIPIFRHCMNEADYAAGCVAGWFMKAKPCIDEVDGCRAMFVYHFKDHPVWLLGAHLDSSGNLRGSREHLVQPGSFTHFHWLTETGSIARIEEVLGVDIMVPPECNVAMAGALTSGVECPGYFLQLRALAPMGNRVWAFEHGGEALVLKAGHIDNKTHLNLITSYRALEAGVLPGTYTEE